MDIINRVENKVMYSNLVYPNWTNRDKFIIIGKLDKEFVEEELERLFEANSIANKYAIKISEDILWYKHDFSIYALKVVGNL